jgi:hypothetical protein
MVEKKASNAEIPPADAPMPTTGNAWIAGSDAGPTCSGFTDFSGAFVDSASAMI